MSGASCAIRCTPQRGPIPAGGLLRVLMPRHRCLSAGFLASIRRCRMPPDDQALRLLAFLLAAHIAGVKATPMEVLADAQEIYAFLRGSADPSKMN